MGQTRPILIISFFSHDKYSTNLTINDKSVDGVLGTQTRGGRMVGTDDSTELWRQKYFYLLSLNGYGDFKLNMADWYLTR